MNDAKGIFANQSSIFDLMTDRKRYFIKSQGYWSIKTKQTEDTRSEPSAVPIFSPIQEDGRVHEFLCSLFTRNGWAEFDETLRIAC